MAADPTITVPVQKRSGGRLLAIANGATLEIETGGIISMNGVDVTAALAAAIPTPIAGVAAGYKIARGQHTTVAASDTVVTGLATVVAVVACLDSDPVDNPFMVSASIGDQAGTPAAGSILIKTWQNTAGNDPTPAAAGVFSKKVNWIAIGT